MTVLGLSCPTEEVESACLMQWAHYRTFDFRGRTLRLSQYLIHVPNGAYLGKDPRTRAITMGKLKAAGLRPGCFDYLLPVPCEKLGYPGLWLELKRLQGGKVSDEQEKFEREMQFLGWRTEICRGWQAAAELIDHYLQIAATRSIPMGTTRLGSHASP